MKWSQTDLAYLAGILDGEGTISVSYRKFTKNNRTKTYHRPHVSVGNTNFVLIEWLHSKFGGCTSEHCYKGNPKHKTIFNWHAKDLDLEQILEAVLPYLILKKIQAECVLKIRKTIFKGQINLSENIIQLRQDLTNTVRQLNQRGVKNVLVV